MCKAPHIYMAKQVKPKIKRFGAAAAKRGVKKSVIKYSKMTKPSKPRESKASNAAGSMILHAADASRLTHVAPHIPLGPYTVVRGRIVIPVKTNAAGQTLTVMLGSYGISSQFNSVVTPVVAVMGEGGNVPGTTETQYVDSVMGVYDSSSPTTAIANGALHALTATLNCVSTATTAAGIVYYGAVNQRVNRQNFATYNDLGNSVITRREMSSKSAYCAMTSPIKLSAYPVDIVDWASQKPLMIPSITLGANLTNDALSQMMFVFPPTTTAVDYVITVHTEWRVNFTDPALSSTSTKHEPGSQSLWDSVMNAGSQLGGKIHEAEGMLATVGAGVGSAMSAYSFASNLIGQVGTVAKSFV